MFIFIKSFNRPYYLDRCLSSIKRYALGDNKIIILDDGTPLKYLEKIKSKYPYIEVIRSEMAEEKTKKIENHAIDGSPVTGLKIPSKFWRDNIFKLAGNYFLLLEDDMWFSESFNLDEALRMMSANNIVLTKLATFGNPRLISGEVKPLSEEILEVLPKLPVTNPRLYRKILVNNPFKILSIAIKTGLVSRLININYYTIYNVAGCIFSKDYYHFLWEDVPQEVEEKLQLAKAVEYMAAKKTRYAFTKNEIIRTSFSSSATNMFKDINFDVFRYNFLLNEAWFKEQLNSCEDLFQDISEEKILPIIQNDPKTQTRDWEKWKNVFRAQYAAVGHKIDH